ncbi:MAG TPA: hypothetical protein PK899_01055, partial [Spirochaetota bacterium]|nr:hypothetical protein [Spirochaetota bacterium]
MVKTNRLFHFVASKRIDSHIKYLRKTLNIGSNRELFDFIMEKMSKNIQNLKKVIGDHKSEYEYIDTEDTSRIHKYVRLNDNKYKMLKKWHYMFNEYGISVILRDIINFFYEGIVKYGAEKYLELIEGKINIQKIIHDLRGVLTHMMRTSEKKRVLYAQIVQNLL